MSGIDLLKLYDLRLTFSSSTGSCGTTRSRSPHADGTSVADSRGGGQSRRCSSCFARRTYPPSPRTKPVPPPRHDQPHVQYAEHVSTFESPKETPTYVREAGVNESTPTVSEARRLSGPAPADDNAQKSTSQKQFETVETEHDEDGNLITKKTITTVKTTRSTRTITGGK